MRVQAEQTSYLLSLTEGTFDMAYVTRRLAAAGGAGAGSGDDLEDAMDLLLDLHDVV
jgi:hypothetical protein